MDYVASPGYKKKKKKNGTFWPPQPADILR